MVLSVGCGPVVDESLVEGEFCDGSNDVTLALRLDNAAYAEGPAQLFHENGQWFIYLNGACELSVRGLHEDEVYPSFWYGDRTTELDKSEVVQLLEDVDWANWSELPANTNSESDAGVVTAYSRGKSRVFSVQPTSRGEQVEDFLTRIRLLRADLEAQTSPLSGEIRVSVAPWGGTDPPLDTESWPVSASLSVEELASSAFCRGDSAPFTAEAADEFRAMRQRFVTNDGSRQKFDYITISDGGELYELYVRDELPSSGENGLVEVPEFTAEAAADCP